MRSARRGKDACGGGVSSSGRAGRRDRQGTGRERRRGSGMPLDPGLHRPRATPDRVGRLLQGERIPHQDSIFEPHTRWISKGKAGRPVELGVAVCVVEDQYQFIITSCCGRKTTWRSRCRIEETQALYPDLRMCSFGFVNPHTRRQARVERATRQGTTQPRRPRAGRSRGVRGHETAAWRWSRRSTRWSPFAPHPRQGLACCAVGAGGEPAPPGAAPATAGAGRQETTQTTRRLIGGGVAHTSAFEPAPEETGTPPYGRVPKIGAVHHQSPHPDRSLASSWTKLGCNWRGKCGGS